MRQLILVVTMVFALMLPALSSAHAVIVQSSLKTSPPSPHQASEIHLFFNSDIEPVLSIVNLVSKGDQKRPLPIRLGEKRGEILVELPALPPGDYALQLKVFAADGHLTEDILEFTIQEEK